MASYQVRVNFDDGVHDYNFPHVQNISDPKEGMKATVIGGTRADGSIVIPGGKKSQTIRVAGILFDADGYEDLTTLMNTLRSNVTTDPATLTLEHWDSTISGGGDWTTDWAYSVVRTEEIDFPDSMRTESQNYTVSFLVTAY